MGLSCYNSFVGAILCIEAEVAVQLATGEENEQELLSIEQPLYCPWEPSKCH